MATRALISLRRAFSTKSRSSLDEYLHVRPKVQKLMEMENRKPPALSMESVNVARLLKNAKSDPEKLKFTVENKVGRLIRRDLVCLFHIFIRAKEINLAETIFRVIQKQKWYKPQTSHYLHLISHYCTASGGFEEKERVMELLKDAEQRCLVTNKDTFIIPMAHLSRQGDFENCLKVYKMMQASSCRKNITFYKALKQRVFNAGLVEEAQQIDLDLQDLIHTQRRSPKLVFEDEGDDFYDTYH